MRVSRDGWTLIVLLLVMTAVFIAFNRPVYVESDLSTTYNPSPNGVRAFYTLLGERLGYKVDRLTSPYTKMPRKARTLIVVAPLKEVPITLEERSALESWIYDGGRAIFISDSLNGVPARFGSTRRLGKGYVYAINSRTAISNKGMRDYRRAMAIIDTIEEHGSPGLILFDEYHHGFGTDDKPGLWGQIEPQVKLGTGMILLAVLAMCYGRGRRFGAVRRLPTSETRRPEFEFVESIGRLYDRAGASDVAAEILLQSLRQRLCLKLGLAGDATASAIVRQLESEGHEQTARRVAELLSDSERKPSKSQLLHMAREISSVEKELNLGEVVA